MADDAPGWDFTGGAGGTSRSPESPRGSAAAGASPDWSTPSAEYWDLPAASPASLGSERPVGPPVALLAAAGTAGALSLVVALFARDRPTVAILGWLCAGFLAVGLLGAFLHVDARRRPSPWYSAPSAIGPLRVVLLVVAILGVAANAGLFALWFGRR